MSETERNPYFIFHIGLVDGTQTEQGADGYLIETNNGFIEFSYNDEVTAIFRKESVLSIHRTDFA